MSKIKTHKHWSQEEIDYVEHNIGLKSSGQIAKELNRTNDSILYCRRINNIGMFNDFYTLNTLATEIGVAKETIRKWCYKGILKYKKAMWKKGNRYPFLIEEKDIVSFIKKYWKKFRGKVISNPYFKNIYLKCKES